MDEITLTRAEAFLVGRLCSTVLFMNGLTPEEKTEIQTLVKTVGQKLSAKERKH